MASGRADAGGTAPPILYGRRRGRRLRPNRRLLLAAALPELALTVPTGPGSLDPRRLFPQSPRAVWLEIGFGAGEHLLAQARSHPDVGCIGCEAFVNGLAALVAAWHVDPVTNIRVLADDARLLLPVLTPTSIERVFLLFPDPWPKLRHAGRRFISSTTVRELARVVVPGGELRIATDAPLYARWTLAHLQAHGEFRWTARRPEDWRTPPADWVVTRYQRRAEAAMRHPIYLSFMRCQPPRG
jgi:tRNA (guanine-N7-)-methyltransferase